MSVIAVVVIGGWGMHGVKIWTEYGDVWSCADGKGGGKEKEGCDQQILPGVTHGRIRYAQSLAG